MTKVQEAVRARYSAAARQIEVSGGCCGGERPSGGGAASCCGDDAPGCGDSYSAEELAALGLSDMASLGCGNPLLLADLRPGERVLDLGSGPGLDVLLSARRVAPGGHAFGVDMTDEMLALAQGNQRAAGIGNATFLKGSIEALPLPDGAVDVVLSNCVINLAEDKGAVLHEAFRVLRPGGRLAVADVVALGDLDPKLQGQLDAWAGCISGTIPVAAYRQLLEAAGFEEIAIDVHSRHQLAGTDGELGSAYIHARKSEPVPS